MINNFHTHSTYCDGSESLESMVTAAIGKGLTALGFSEHCHAYYAEYNPSREEILEYMREVLELREKYADKIEIFLGIEHEVDADWLPDGFEYIIGAAHDIKIGDEFVSVDYGAEGQRRAAEQYFGGDYYAMAEAYFETTARIKNADIIAHFDLITKYNLNGGLFDESHPKYVAAAISAMDEILKTQNLFEVNTGAMYRVGKTEPYPSAFLLKELYNRGGEVILSSDSHDGASLCYKFDEMKELLRHIGFRHLKTFTKNGFVNIDL